MALDGRAGRGPQATPQETRPGRWCNHLVGADSNWWLVAALAVTFMIAFAPLVYRRHAGFTSFGWDMGILDQAAWLISRGHSFITVRGLDFFGHHASFAMYLFAPFYWLGAGVHFLNVVQVASMGAGAVPVYLIARDRLGRGWMALVPVAVYLLHPALGFLSWELFHPEVMAITPLLFAWWFASRQRWGWYTASAVYAVAWKEDVAPAVLVLGIVVALRGQRRVGVITALAALAWFLFVLRVMLPAVAGEAFYGQLYQGIGSTPVGIFSGAVEDPGNLARRLVNDEARTYLWQMFAPFAFVPLAAPAALMVGVPQFLANLLSDYVWTREIRFHYAAIPVAALTLGMIEGVAWLGRRRPRLAPAVLGGVLVTAAVTTVAWGVSPIGAAYDEGYWGSDSSRVEVKRAAVDVVPGGEPVSASYFLVAHLSHRERIYQFPNPWKSKNWGIRDQHPHDPADVRWIVVDRQTVAADEAQILDRMLVSGEFRARFDQAHVVVAKRVRAPWGPEGAPGRLDAAAQNGRPVQDKGSWKRSHRSTRVFTPKPRAPAS